MATFWATFRRYKFTFYFHIWSHWGWYILSTIGRWSWVSTCKKWLNVKRINTAKPIVTQTLSLITLHFYLQPYPYFFFLSLNYLRMYENKVHRSKWQNCVSAKNWQVRRRRTIKCLRERELKGEKETADQKSWNDEIERERERERERTRWKNHCKYLNPGPKQFYRAQDILF